MKPLVAVLVCVLSACALACAGQPSAADMRLPDISRSPASVRDQLRSMSGQLQPRWSDGLLSGPERAEAAGRMGMLFMAAEYLDAAERLYSMARALDPRSSQWPYLLGQLYRLRSEPHRASGAFEQALALGRTDVATFVWLGHTRLELDQAERARPLFEEALRQRPGLVSAQYGLGRVSLAQREYREAVGYFEAALAADPRASIVHYPLALAYRALGDQPLAEAHLLQRGTFEIGPPDPLMQEMAGLLESAASYEFRGVRALERGDPETAARLFTQGLALEPGTVSLLHRLGTVLAVMGDSAGAARRFQEALTLAPDHTPTLYSAGILRASRGDFADAARHFTAAVEHAPEYLEARVALAEMLVATGKPAEALPHFDVVLRTRPQDRTAVEGRALALAALRSGTRSRP